MAPTSPGRPARGWRLAACTLAACGLWLGPAGPALAEPPSRLDEQITDTVGALGGQTDEVAAALASLQAEQGIQLWVAYVETFDGLSGADWATETAQLSGFGGNDMLFAVAIGDRAYGYDVADEFPVSDATIEEILAADVEPQLAAEEWAGAVIELADGLAGAGSGGSGDGGAGTGGATGGGGGSALPWLIGAAVVIGGVVLLVVMAGRRKGRGAPGGSAGGTAEAPQAPAAPTIEEQRQEAAAVLIDADDSIKTSEQELGFAIAQFGEAAAAEFTAALAASKAELGQAFEVQRRAQDAVGQPQEAELLAQLVALCRSADARLDAQVESFDALRDLERTIDTVLPGLGEQVGVLTSRLDTSRATARDLSTKWPAAALANLMRNLEQAAERVTFAEESVRTGTDLLAGGDRNGAVAKARAAEESVGQATDPARRDRPGAGGPGPGAAGDRRADDRDGEGPRRGRPARCARRAGLDPPFRPRHPHVGPRGRRVGQLRPDRHAPRARGVRHRTRGCPAAAARPGRDQAPRARPSCPRPPTPPGPRSRPPTTSSRPGEPRWGRRRAPGWPRPSAGSPPVRRAPTRWPHSSTCRPPTTCPTRPRPWPSRTRPGTATARPAAAAAAVR